MIELITFIALAILLLIFTYPLVKRIIDRFRKKAKVSLPDLTVNKKSNNRTIIGESTFVLGQNTTK